MTDWGNLSFAYSKTKVNTRCYYKNGEWGKVEISTDENISLHMSATCLHYGQECFEGLKAYRGKDNKVRLFRWQENAKRMNLSASRLCMPEIPEELFGEAIITLLKENDEFIPPYGTGASLYIRPLLIGSGAQLGLSPAQEYTLVIFCSPVGPYFKGGVKPVKVIVERETDRAAPLGTGNVKVGGNYAPALATTQRIQKEGYSSAMYLDPKEKKYIDECGPANFFAIKDNTYITPLSDSILNSITNKSLQDLALSFGMKVEKRKVLLSELDTFEEVGQCGTAAVLTSIYTIFDPIENVSYTFGDKDTVSKTCLKLYETLVGIQYGEVEENFGWITIVE